MIANIASDDALILPHRANPAGLNFRERQVSYRALYSANTSTTVRFTGDTNRTRSCVTA